MLQKSIEFVFWLTKTNFFQAWNCMKKVMKLTYLNPIHLIRGLLQAQIQNYPYMFSMWKKWPFKLCLSIQKRKPKMSKNRMVSYGQRY